MANGDNKTAEQNIPTNAPVDGTAAATKPKTYNPLMSPVNEKAYTTMSVDADPSKLQTAIPQPDSIANRVSPNENAYGMLGDMSMAGGGGVGGGGGNPNSGAAPLNPAMNGIPSAEKKMGAEQLAKLLVDAYEQLNIFANRGLQISPRKVRKLVADGEIDLSVQVPYDYGKTISAGEFIETINEQNKDIFSVSKEFKREITPPLVRILEKRGAGLTDEQFVGYMLGKDVLLKGFMAFGVMGAIKDAIEVIKEYTIAAKEGGYVTPPPTAARPETTADYEATPSPTYTQPSPPPVSANDANFNFVTNDAYNDSIVTKHVIPEDGKAALLERRKLDRAIEAAIKKNAPEKPKPSSEKVGKRGRKPKDYIPKMDEDEIAEALVLRETKVEETDKIKGLD